MESVPHKLGNNNVEATERKDDGRDQQAYLFDRVPGGCRDIHAEGPERCTCHDEEGHPLLNPEYTPLPQCCSLELHGIESI